MGEVKTRRGITTVCRSRGHRQKPKGHNARKGKGNGQQGGGHRPTDKGRGDTNGQDFWAKAVLVSGLA